MTKGSVAHMMQTARKRLRQSFKPVSSAKERALAVELLYGPEAPADIISPTGISILDVVRFHLRSADFERRVVQSAPSVQDQGLTGPVRTAVLVWARDKLPMEASTHRLLASAVSRWDVFARLFADPTFVGSVLPEEGWPWSPGVFMAGAPPSEPTRRLLRKLMARRSPLLDGRLLRRWGLDFSTSPDHVYKYGFLAQFKTNDLFDRDFYRVRYGTRSANYFDDLLDYANGGEALGRAPNPFLNTDLLARIASDLAPEIREGRLSCLLEHLLEHDHQERRSAASHFDSGFYIGQVSAENRREFSSPFAHYVNVGWRAGLEPNPCFDQLWYLQTHADVREGVRDGIWPNAFAHFVMVGEEAGYSPCAFFDPTAYALANKDIADSKTTTPFRHFWQQGRLEARNFGSAHLAPIAQHFFQRLPDSRDLLDETGLRRASGLPQDVLERAGSTSDGRDAVSLLTSEPPQKDVPGMGHLLRALGRPIVNIEVGRKQQIHVGDTTRFYLSGLASLGSLGLKRVRVLSDLAKCNCEFFRYFRLDDIEFNVLSGAKIEGLKGGLMAWFEFSASALSPGDYHLDLQFEFNDDGPGRPVLWHETIHVEVLARPGSSESAACVQVAMATFDPPEIAFARQVDSILANPGVDLLVSDDASPPSGARVLAPYSAHPRVMLDVSARNANFVSNFERSLYMRSDSAEVLLFSDQDDVWSADKVSKLVALLEPGVSCAFSDMRIVKNDGEVISETFWQGRRVHFHDPITLSVANTVTGAAAAFPAAIAEMLTPFPRYMGVYHDQWLAVLAAAAGRIAYHPRPLYDYVQHGANVLGFSGSRAGSESHWRSISRRLRSAVRRGYADRRDLAYVEVALASTIPLLQRFVLLHEALFRVPVWEDTDVQTLAQVVVDAVAGKAIDARIALRQWRRLARRAGGEEGLLNIDDMVIAVFTARSMVETGLATMSDLYAARRSNKAAWEAQVIRDGDKGRGLLQRKTEPLKARRSSTDTGTLRVNMFLPELQLATFFGGYHSKLSLISRLEDRGVRTRLILLDQPVVDHAGIASIVGAFPELEAGLMKAEIEAYGSRAGILDIGPSDALLATTWWSAHVANALRHELERERFLYFIQEYEPFTFDLGTYYRAAELTYDFPHDAIFSTEILRDFFAETGVGVFGPKAVSQAEALAFRNPITGLKGIARRPLAKRKPRLLFYARPQAHASRNMYEFGLAALREAASVLGSELDGWQIVGVGANESGMVKLGPDRELELIGKLDSHAYRVMLSSSDVGLALMYTPHPSLVPLEMAAAGLVTVTNACMTKTQTAFDGISDLIHVAEADVCAIAEALAAAVRRVNGGAIPHDPIDWPVDPASAFPDDWLNKFLESARRSLGGPLKS